MDISEFELIITNNNFKEFFPFIPDETNPKFVELMLIYVIKEEENSIM